MSDKSAWSILKAIIKKKVERPLRGATPVETSLNDDGVINEAVRGGRKHPLYKKYRGLVVSIKKNKQKKTKKKRSPKKLLKNIRKEIKKRKRKGTQKENKKVEAWKLQEKKLSGGRRKTRKKRGGDPIITRIYNANKDGIEEGFEKDKEYKVTNIKDNMVYFNYSTWEGDENIEKPIFDDFFILATPGGRKKKRKGRCTKKKRRRRR